MVEQKRKSHRYHPGGSVVGNFGNRERFVLEDISVDGLKLVSNFAPIIGSRYAVRLTQNGITRDIAFKVTHVEQAGYNSCNDGIMPEGVLYGVGGKFLDLDAELQQFILKIMYGK